MEGRRAERHEQDVLKGRTWGEIEGFDGVLNEVKGRSDRWVGEL